MKHPSSSPLSLGFGLIPREKEADPEPSGQSHPPKRKVLVVDQDPSRRRIITAHLSNAGYAVDTAESGQMALDACARIRPHLVISELRLADVDGLALLKELQSRWPRITVIILTTHATISEAVQATQGGAFSFLVKPVGKHELLGHVERATAASNLPPSDGDWRDQIAARSRLREGRMAIANRAAGSEMPLLLTGAYGSGKELLARSIHAASSRRDKPFVAVSGKATTGADPEAELFGAFERANGGTLMLEEVGEFSASLQLALLRVLRKELEPTAPRHIRDAAKADVRLICTTSQDLRAAVETGQFSQELCERIGVLPIDMPPLGRRREDLPLLVSDFLAQAKEPGGQEAIYTPQAIERLATTDWPARVRQLFDLVKQKVALEIVRSTTPEGRGEIPTYDEARNAFAREYLAGNLQRTSGNVTQAARIAKRTRTDFYKLLARYRVHPDDFKPTPPGPDGDEH
jgi:two-component system response regulator GlrR